MPPKKNKKSHNDFYYFMQDQKKILPTEGIYWESMDELVSICHPRWKSLSDDAKAKYKEIAKQSKGKENLHEKYDSRGRSLAFVEAEQRQRQTQLEQMNKRIKSIIDQAKDNLKTQKFFLIHINKLCRISEDKVLPCELALVEFDLANGIIGTLHTFIRPPNDEIPLGFGFEIQKNADERHGLTLEDDPMLIENSSDFQTIIDKIMLKINPGGVRQPVFPLYTLEEDEEMTKNIMVDLCTWAGLKSYPEFHVFHVHQLMFHLSQALLKSNNPERIKTESFAADLIASDIYSYTVGMGCPYHDKIDKPRFCSLNCAKRWAFLIMDHCCPVLNLEQKPDTHCHIEKPAYSRYDLPYKQEMLVQWRPSLEDDGTQTSTELDRDFFGAAKTRAAPAGFVAVDEALPNPKKMTTKEREEWTKKLAAQGSSFAEWTEMVSALPEKPSDNIKEPPCPWAVPESTSKIVPLMEEPPCPWAVPEPTSKTVPLLEEPPCPWETPKQPVPIEEPPCPWEIPPAVQKPSSNPWASKAQKSDKGSFNNDDKDFPSLKGGRGRGRKK